MALLRPWNRLMMLAAALLSILIVPVAVGLSDTNPGIFRQITPEQSGIHWSHVNARSGRRYLPETIPPGVAIFDYDNDGWMDLFFVNAGESTFFLPPKHRLQRSSQTTMT